MASCRITKADRSRAAKLGWKRRKAKAAARKAARKRSAARRKSCRTRKR